MKIVSFELTMPNKGSWNGQWTGQDKKYFIIKSFTDKYFKLIEPSFEGKLYNNFYYNWGDGWGANVRMEIINSSEASKRRKLSKGFCGYEWMIDSILKRGYIITENDFAKSLTFESK